MESMRNIFVICFYGGTHGDVADFLSCLDNSLHSNNREELIF